MSRKSRGGWVRRAGRGDPGARISTSPRKERGEATKRPSALQQRRDTLRKFLERGFALEHLAVDEEGRGRIDLQNFAGVFLVGRDLVEQGLILEAILDIL